MSRFVILTHDHPFLHWDLMLEDDNILRTWRLLTSPDSALPIAAEQLPNHRPFYLDYEGPVSNNRGTVKRFDAGEYQIIEESEQLLIISLTGNYLNGKYTLQQISRSSQTESDWIFTVWLD